MQPVIAPLNVIFIQLIAIYYCTAFLTFLFLPLKAQQNSLESKQKIKENHMFVRLSISPFHVNYKYYNLSTHMHSKSTQFIKTYKKGHQKYFGFCTNEYFEIFLTNNKAFITSLYIRFPSLYSIITLQEIPHFFFH